MGVPTSDDFFTDSVLTDTINEAQATIEAEQRWPWLEYAGNQTLTAGTTAFTVPLDWRATRAVFNGASELALVSPTDIMRIQGSGGPSAWSVRGNQVLVAPSASSDVTLTHYYYRVSMPLVLDTDTVVMPDQFTDSIVCKAAELLSAREDDNGARQAHATDYSRWVDRMKRDVRRSTGPVRVRVRPGGWI